MRTGFERAGGRGQTRGFAECEVGIRTRRGSGGRGSREGGSHFLSSKEVVYFAVFLYAWVGTNI
jgi:hypothetical protein